MRRTTLDIPTDVRGFRVICVVFLDTSVVSQNQRKFELEVDDGSKMLLFLDMQATSFIAYKLEGLSWNPIGVPIYSLVTDRPIIQLTCNA